MWYKQPNLRQCGRVHALPQPLVGPGILPDLAISEPTPVGQLLHPSWQPRPEYGLNLTEVRWPTRPHDLRARPARSSGGRGLTPEKTPARGLSRRDLALFEQLVECKGQPEADLAKRLTCDAIAFAERHSRLGRTIRDGA